MSTLIHQQPGKAIYITFDILTTFFFRIPTWIITSLVPAWRPRASWSIKRAVVLKLIRHISELSGRVNSLTPKYTYRAIAPGKDVKGVWIDPTPNLIAGDLKTWVSIAEVEPIRVPGYWLHRPDSTIEVASYPMPGEKVIYSIHGGAYTKLSAHPSDPTATIPKNLIKHISTVHRAFSIEYRLTELYPYPANPFPCALLDTLAGYNYLVNVVGFTPADIIVEGDSAGGNLALALVRYLLEYKGLLGLPLPPSALILLSPWVDLGIVPLSPSSSVIANGPSDYIRLSSIAAMSKLTVAFTGPLGLGAASFNRYISPGHPTIAASFTGFPSTYIVAGEAEVLRDQIRVLKDKMIRDMGKENVRYCEVQDEWHDHTVFSICEPARTRTYKDIAVWVMSK